MMAAEAGIRPWFEYVESEANIADGFSRDGLAWRFSREALQLKCTAEDARLPDLSSLLNAPASALGNLTALLRGEASV